jgi:hypothetical protein
MQSNGQDHLFSGSIYVFHALDVGDDISFEKIRKAANLTFVSYQTPKYFKNYHAPLSIKLPSSTTSPDCISCKIHNFGAISLTYKLGFSDTLHGLRSKLNALESSYQEQSLKDCKALFPLIQHAIAKPQFFQTRSSYVVIQVNPQPDQISLNQLKEQYGSIIASALRFETQSLSEYQKDEILESVTGYFRGDLLIIDTDASFVYDAEYEEILEFFEFANIQLLELRYFDHVLDQRLNKIYEGEMHRQQQQSHIPFFGMFAKDPIADLGKVKAEISVIVERLQDSIMLAGEPYFTEIHNLLVDRLDINSFKESINRKLEIIQGILVTQQHHNEVMRGNILEILIIVLISMEFILGLLSYFK